MPRFHQSRDHVSIVSGEERYHDTAANFAADYGAPAPTLPQGVIERIYEPGKRHALHDAEGNVITTMDAECPRSWHPGGAAIAAIHTILVNQVTRRADAEIADIHAKVDGVRTRAGAEIAAIVARRPA